MSGCGALAPASPSRVCPFSLVMRLTAKPPLGPRVPLASSTLNEAEPLFRAMRFPREREFTANPPLGPRVASESLTFRKTPLRVTSKMGVPSLSFTAKRGSSVGKLSGALMVMPATAFRAYGTAASLTGARGGLAPPSMERVALVLDEDIDDAGGVGAGNVALRPKE